MRLTVNFRKHARHGAGKGPVQVGWFLNPAKARHRFISRQSVWRSCLNMDNKRTPKRERCLGGDQLESALFHGACPFDAELCVCCAHKDGKQRCAILKTGRYVR